MKYLAEKYDLTNHTFKAERRLSEKEKVVDDSYGISRVGNSDDKNAEVRKKK